MPWEYPWLWKDQAERDLTNKTLQRIHHDPTLRHAVAFDGFGRDVGSWLRRIGFVLSTSDIESFHLAAAEGMASGAVPVIINWPGADTNYSSRWVHETTDEMADFIYETVISGEWSKLGREAQDEVRSAFALPVVSRQWARILTDNLEPSTAATTVVCE
jgi:glycosyltransferase involved in cell wall biosynthesis